MLPPRLVNRQGIMIGFKNRYLVVEVFLDPNREYSVEPIIITQFNISKAIKDSILINFGECGLASSLGSFQGESDFSFSIESLAFLKAPQFSCTPILSCSCEPDNLSVCVIYGAVKYVNPITKLCIIRTSREDHKNVWAAISMVRSIGNCPVLFNLLDISGSIRACKSAALKCDELKFEQHKLTPGASVSAEVIQQMQNCLEKIKVLEH